MQAACRVLDRGGDGIDLLRLASHQPAEVDEDLVDLAHRRLPGGRGWLHVVGSRWCWCVCGHQRTSICLIARSRSTTLSCVARAICESGARTHAQSKLRQLAEKLSLSAI